MKKSGFALAAMAIAGVVIVAALPATARMGDKGEGREHASERMGAMFTELDTDGDGRITPEEMSARHAARFTATDSNGDGKISPDEMKADVAARAAERAVARSEKRIARMIEWRDGDGDGALSIEEMGEGRHGEMMERLDRDGDGAVTEEEFASMQKRRQRGGRGRDRGEHGEHHGQRRGQGDDRN